MLYENEFARVTHLIPKKSRTRLVAKITAYTRGYANTHSQRVRIDSTPSFTPYAVSTMDFIMNGILVLNTSATKTDISAQNIYFLYGRVTNHKKRSGLRGILPLYAVTGTVSGVF